MRNKLRLKHLSQFTRGKVITAFLIAGVAIIFSWIISRAVFSDIETSLNNLSEPNQRLMIVNRLLEKVSRLDQLQRIQALKKTKATNFFLRETQQIRLTLDTLSDIYDGNEIITGQIDSMYRILTQRDKVYIDYISLRAYQQNNPKFLKELKELTGFIKENAPLRDSSIITTENKITTITIPKKNEDESFWKRLFGKRKQQEAEQTVSEERKVKVDTISTANQEKIVKDIDNAVKRMEKDQALRNNAMLLQELNLINNGNTLINELWNLLHKIQEDELSKVRTNSTTAIAYFNSTINKAGFILMVFFLVIAALVYAILADLTKSNLYRLQLQQAKEEAEHMGVMKQRFLSNMSHEIRTPLQSIIGFSEQIKNQPHSDQKMINAIHSSAEHLLHIVNEILDYSRITSGKFVLEKRVFNLSNLINEVTQNMQLQAEQKGLSFTCINKISEHENFIGDGFRIKQILYNLLGNAIKFTDTGGIVLHIIKNQAQEIQLKITDSGTGIPKENLTQIFNEFEQTDESITRKFGGTGLGLSITKTLVETMQGRIDVESEMHIGTTFTLSIPLAETGEKSDRQLNETVINKPITNKRTIIIDDDSFILELCNTILNKHNIKHACFSSAEELLTEEWDTNTKIVFTDMRLPGKSGVELMQLLKKQHNNVLFIALTAQVLPDEKSSLINAGFDGILSKPFREYEFLSFYEKATVTGKGNIEHAIKSNSTIDLSALKRMVMNDESLMAKHLSSFIACTEQDLTLLRQSMAQEHQEEAFELIHKLATRVGQIGDKELMLKFRELENGLKQPNRLSQLNNQINSAITATEKMIGEVKLMETSLI